MAEQNDDSDKTLEATQHKLDEARKKGEFARSADLNTVGTYAGLLLALSLASGTPVETVGANLMTLVEHSDQLAKLIFQGGLGASALGGIAAQIVFGLSLFLLLPMVMALAAVIAQRAFVVAPTKIEPRVSRINPVENAKNKFGATGLFEFAKSFGKLFLYSLLLGGFLTYRLPEMMSTLHAEAPIIGAVMGKLIIEFMIIVLLISLAIGGLDYLWQYFDHLRRQRMSHKDLRDELKQNDGDPAVKQQRRRRAMELASGRMMADVPTADVVIVNPTHFAVALKWSRKPGAAPTCVAKGMDHIALAIRDLARESGVPILEDAPTARALHATTEIGREIDPAHYAAVAVAIRFSEDMRRKARSFG
ncbi:flagellar biosynthetic protein FlhB [Roseovarius sp. TM1035]|jgi:flagellar biosynthetic protein FlhB|uniref:EscU/YscU/HrcU family type III secretion system export apparatus switch protein n=1 Tax=Roseovarius sp. TM1035 TaxID=391613 RepID=UPI0001556B50|nr:flagellar type III secretion system protein FlhB [Roseovarius sp. TM1035]AWZ20187.1 Flagellar biosynthesis protein FlhB [Roseovarius sp. AK1035]EDM31702.1 flagellar biosynthetic protein FlhB [Roseovarius sp. TM1035]